MVVLVENMDGGPISISSEKSTQREDSGNPPTENQLGWNLQSVEVGMVDRTDEEYKQEVMLTCKLLLDSIKEGKQLPLAGIIDLDSNKVQFIAKIIKLGDTFRSEATQPIYGLLFTTEGEEYLLRKADEVGLKSNAKVLITIQLIDDKEMKE